MPGDGSETEDESKSKVDTGKDKEETKGEKMSVIKFDARPQ